MAHKMPHTTGDSTKYRGQDTLDAVDAYIAGRWREVEGQVCPTMTGFAVWSKISRPTLGNWADKHQDFAAKLTELKTFCENYLVQGALGELYSAPIAKLVLSHAHGYVEKSQIETIAPQTPEGVIGSIKKLLGNRGENSE
jgi:hypothetical protein